MKEQPDFHPGACWVSFVLGLMLIRICFDKILMLFVFATEKIMCRTLSHTGDSGTVITLITDLLRRAGGEIN